ncbi:hypothetical protein TWF481_003149 [Arthrobotrys musiformis]|uniref:BTB domain-containing protein n=1 Tax=Arthrobotrys musiformis TaxID=47236 RepID=A0AAV9VPE4_9PEZI
MDNELPPSSKTPGIEVIGSFQRGTDTLPFQKLAPEQARERALRSIVPNDRFADQKVIVGGEVYRLHAAITCAQSKYFDSNFEVIRRENGLGSPFPVRVIAKGIFDRVLAWMYFGKGATVGDSILRLTHLVLAASFLKIPPLLLQVFTVVSSPEYSSKYLENRKTAIVFLNNAYIHIEKESHPECWDILDGLCVRIIEGVPAETLADLPILRRESEWHPPAAALWQAWKREGRSGSLPGTG